MPKVSVVVTVYNVEKYIQRCIESIQKQTVKDIEILVVDDATPDNSMDIVEEIANNDNRIKIVRHEKNMGLMWARKTGYTAAQGEYITFCDSDDYLPIDAVELQYKEAVFSGADIVSGNLAYVEANGKQSILCSKLKYGNDKVSAFKSLLRGELRHNLCSKLFKASILKDYTYKTYEHFTNGEDGCLFYQVIDNTSKIVHINLPVYYYFQNTESSSRVRYNEKAIKSICIVNKTRQDITSRYPELKADRNKCITNILCSLYAQGYDKDANLMYYIRDFGLSRYISFFSVIKYCSFRNLVRLVFKRTLLRFS
ncbi:MAG: glycosyltransferase family 2 protein [Aeriscardovia sp.]|nr:glycosyltransferase family 2 protein [Aeriscardovia sp.]